MRDYTQIAIEVMIQVREAGIVPGDIKRIVTNNRTKNRWGQCRRTLNRSTGKVEYEIEIGEWMTDEKFPETLIRNTIAHEILHSCEGCMNHGAKWHGYAMTMNNKYGYDIQTYATKEEMAMRNEVEPIKYKYTFKCEKCGEIIGQHRACKFTKHPEKYQHTGCGGKFVKIK